MASENIENNFHRRTRRELGERVLHPSMNRVKPFFGQKPAAKIEKKIFFVFIKRNKKAELS